MATLPNPADGAKALASHLRDIKSALEGAATYTAAWYLRQTSGNMGLELSTNDGSTAVRVLDSDQAVVASIDSNGLATFNGMTLTTFTFPTSATPNQTTEGQAVWDSDDDLLTVGDGSSRQTFYPGEMYPSVVKYKTAAQVFTTDTTFADITASSGNFAFPVVANGVYRVHIELNVTYGGSGGLKLQLTGPAAPTLVHVYTVGPSGVQQGADGGTNVEDAFTHTFAIEFAAVTGFSSAFVSTNSSAVDNVPYLVNGRLYIDALIVNGANAGTVTLQGAQNSSNSTTTFGAGCWMEARRLD